MRNKTKTAPDKKQSCHGRTRFPAFSRFPAFASNSDWFVALFTFVEIGSGVQAPGLALLQVVVSNIRHMPHSGNN